MRAVRAITTSIACTLVFRGTSPAVQAESGTSSFGSFAFADTSGTLLLGSEGLTHPERFHFAWCDGGRRVSIAFVRLQKRSPAAIARDLARDFARLDGAIYRVHSSRLRPDV